MIKIEESIPLNDHCTLAIGGPARFFTVVESVEQMQEAICICRDRGWPYFILGKGSNTLFDDRGFNGLVILNKIIFLEQLNETLFRVGSGYSFSRLGVQTARKGFSGLEFASGIPGTVGGAVFMNAGANGAETGDTLVSVEFIDEEGGLLCLSKEGLEFSYRRSSFHERRGVIAAATFCLKGSKEARSHQLKILDYRIQTQPYSEKSAGCMFRNPEGSSAGALIERCGLKGTMIGDAQVSDLHANFIINKKKATSQQVVALIAAVKERVARKSGVQLESEVRVVPFQEGAL